MSAGACGAPVGCCVCVMPPFFGSLPPTPASPPKAAFPPTSHAGARTCRRPGTRSHLLGRLDTNIEVRRADPVTPCNTTTASSGNEAPGARRAACCPTRPPCRRNLRIVPPCPGASWTRATINSLGPHARPLASARRTVRVFSAAGRPSSFCPLVRKPRFQAIDSLEPPAKAILQFVLLSVLLSPRRCFA